MDLPPTPEPDGPGGPRSRRRFLRDGLVLGGTVAAGGLVLDLTGCSSTPPTGGAAGPSSTAPDTRPAATSGPASTTADPTATVGPRDVLVSLSPATGAVSADAAVREACALLDWSWLDRGDSVFVKLASNSPHAHPSVTSPAAVRGLVAELHARGAGRVIVGDQAGVEYVRRVADGQRFGSTMDCLRSNGLHEAIVSSGAEPHAFDDHDYREGFFEATPPPGSHWSQPLALPTVIRDVDHVVYLPRISAHAIAGYTAGHKVSIGWLRDDSRNHVHSDAASFYEKYTEVNYVPELRDRFRLALVLGEQLLLHFGPDINGTVVPADPRLVLASGDLASLDAVMSGLLVHLNETTPPAPGVVPYRAATANAVNRGFVTTYVKAKTDIAWGPATAADYRPLTAHAFEQGVSGDRSLARAWEITGRPEAVHVVSHGAALDPELAAAVTAHGEGMLSFA